MLTTFGILISADAFASQPLTAPLSLTLHSQESPISTGIKKLADACAHLSQRLVLFQTEHNLRTRTDNGTVTPALASAKKKNAQILTMFLTTSILKSAIANADHQDASQDSTGASMNANVCTLLLTTNAQMDTTGTKCTELASAPHRPALQLTVKNTTSTLRLALASANTTLLLALLVKSSALKNANACALQLIALLESTLITLSADASPSQTNVTICKFGTSILALASAAH